MTLGKTFRVYHNAKQEQQPYLVLLEQRNKSEALLFENGYIHSLTSSQVDSIKKTCSSRLPDAYGCLGILELNQNDVKINYLILVNSCLSVGKVLNSEIFRVTETYFVSLRNNPADIDRIQEVRKVLNSGTFYFSWALSGKALDLTLCEQRAQASNESDNRFFWNRTMHMKFLQDGIDCNEWLLKIICGGIEVRTIYVGHLQARGCIFSRLSSERAGTRFNVRGTDDDGCVANMVETEQVIYLDNKVCSYVQIRGSVPLFFEQPGVQVGSHKIKLSRGSEASAPSFERHLSQIQERYGDQVMINLLGSKEGEAMLSKVFQSHHKASKYCKTIPYIPFDYHAQCRGGRQENLSILKQKITSQLESFGFFLKDTSETVKSQNGTFRTNCLDCLDRTNNVQTFIGLEVLKQQLQALSIADQPQIISRFIEVFKQMWIQNGDQVSKMYAGTGALEGRSKLKDGSRSVVRTIQNNLLDSSKQEAIDLILLGSLLYNDAVERARTIIPPSMLNMPANFLETLYNNKKSFTTPHKIKLAIGTWNVNGGKHFNSIVFKHQSMTEYLLDCPKLSAKSGLIDVSDVDNSPADIYAIGFEEIVDLNASNIVSASSENQKEWMMELQKTISRDNKYIYITSTQLVGVCLFLFSLPKHAPYIKDVAVDAVKTGLGGATGNKGGVAIRLSIYSTPICFVCAHLAAGQKEIFERNADYQEISRKLAFPMGRALDSHKYIFWCGDFNYRIDLATDEVKKLVKLSDWAALLAADQLLNAQQARQAFHGFLEAPINFAPTYKYDIFSDDYDTSEKNRSPAWTDRVLFKNKWSSYDEETCDKITFYGRAELKTSDHRPVIAYVNINVDLINGPQRLQLFQSLLDSGPPDCSVVIEIQSNSLLDDETRFRIIDTIFIEKEASIKLYQFIAVVTFKSGKDALEALQYDNEMVDGYRVTVQLKNPDWKENIYKIVKLCQNNTIPFKSSYPPSNINAENLFNELLKDEEDLAEKLHSIEEEVNSHVLNSLAADKDFLGIVEGADYDVSSGRTSPFPEMMELTRSPVKLPPRPPPPGSVNKPGAPMRPPPPQKLQPDKHMNSNEDPNQNKKDNTHSNESASNATSEQNNDGYQSCPPPMEPPPPPPPNLSKSKKSTTKASESSTVTKSSETTLGQPPPIPSRPKLPSRPTENMPPPIPARPSSSQPTYPAQGRSAQ